MTKKKKMIAIKQFYPEWRKMVMDKEILCHEETSNKSCFIEATPIVTNRAFSALQAINYIMLLFYR